MILKLFHFLKIKVISRLIPDSLQKQKITSQINKFLVNREMSDSRAQRSEQKTAEELRARLVEVERILAEQQLSARVRAFRERQRDSLIQRLEQLERDERTSISSTGQTRSEQKTAEELRARLGEIERILAEQQLSARIRAIRERQRDSLLQRLEQLGRDERTGQTSHLLRRMLRQTSSKTEATQALLGLSTRQQIELERDVTEALLASSSTQPIEQRLEEKVASDVHLDQDLGEVQPMEEEQHLEAEKGNILPNTGPVIGLKIASLNIAEITRDLQGVQIDFMTPLDEETVSFEGLSNRYVKAKQQNTVLISRLRTRNIKLQFKLQSAVEKYWAMAEEPEDENKSKLFYETTSKLLREWDSSKWWLNVTKKKIKEEAIPDLPEKRIL
jgi:hypothetical protein